MHSFTTLFCAILTDLRGAIAHIAARDRAPFLTFFCARISPTAQLFDLFERLLAEWRNGTLPGAAACHLSPTPAPHAPAPHAPAPHAPAPHARRASQCQPTTATPPSSPDQPNLPRAGHPPSPDFPVDPSPDYPVDPSPDFPSDPCPYARRSPDSLRPPPQPLRSNAPPPPPQRNFRPGHRPPFACQNCSDYVT